MRRLLLPIVLLVAVCVRGTAAADPAPAPRNLVYVTLDGLRWQEVFGGAQESYFGQDAGVKDAKSLREAYVRPTLEERRAALMPFLWNTVAKDGQILGDPDSRARVRTENRHRFSYPGYSEMFVGFADDETIRSNDKVPNPHRNVLAFLAGRPGFERRVAAYATWDVIPFILDAERGGFFVHAGTGPIVDDPLTDRQRQLNELVRDAAVLWKGNGLDVFTWHAALEHLRKHKPRVLYVGLGETDEWGHGRRYDLYLHAARKSDAALGRLWQELQTMPEYAGRTSLVISTDHGRGGTIRDWTDHGAKVPGAESLWIAALGPDVPPLGVRRDVETTQSQIAATLAELVGEDFRAASPKSAAPLPEVVRRAAK